MSEQEDLERLIAHAINAHRNLHQVYGNTSTCSGGIGGSMFTQHCAVTCPYDERHGKENDAWESVERAFFSRRDGDPDWARFLQENP